MKTKKRIAVVVCCSLVVFGSGGYVGHIVDRPSTVCIQVDPNGAPAPDTCADPNSYQVTP
jgi:hypothetical protein